MRGGDRSGIAYDERFGHKVRGNRLRRDFYTGAQTIDPDPMHPQDTIIAPGPDGVGRPYAPGPMHASANDVAIGVEMIDPVTFERSPWPRMGFNPCPQILEENF